MRSISFLVFTLIPLTLYSQWVELNPIADQSWQSVYFIDPYNGWISGANGVIIHTTDGGASWIQQESGVIKHLRKIRFADLQNGWAVGDNGTIIHTSNGGFSWNIQESGVVDNLHSLHVLNNNFSYVGGYGYLLRTSNGGINWDKKNFITSTWYIHSVFFSDTLNGWVTAFSGPPYPLGMIGHTIDGGNSWSSQFSTGQWMQDVFFIDNQNGWIAGPMETILVTNNGGNNWFYKSILLDDYQSYSVRFINPNLGWVISKDNWFYNSDLRCTTNGGDDWNGQFSTSNKILLELSFSDQLNGWAVGTDGLVLHTVNGGGIFPTIPKLIYPINNQLVSADSINFKWSFCVPNTTNYSLNISEDSLFINYTDTLISDTSLYMKDLEPNKNYYWRVRASNQLGWGNYSSIGAFNTSITDVQDNLKDRLDFNLSQNYPNPFNPSTKISWQSPVSSRQTIKVFNTLGQEVETIVNEYLEAGFHSKLYIINSSLPSGVYYYQLRAGSFVETKKMIYLK